MRLLLCIPWMSTLAAALQTSSEDDRPRRKVFGAENRHCHAGTKTKQDTSIIGGHVVEDPDRYPFLAWIGDRDGTGMTQFCGGSLIHPRIVLTAGHCVYTSDMLNAGIYVRFRLANFAKTKGIERGVINWQVHEHYSPNTLDNDIALFLLDQDITSEEVQPVTLSDGLEPSDDEANATITGWGSTDEDCRVYDTYLRDSQVPIGKRGKTCSTPGSRLLKGGDIDPARQICAGYYKKDAMEYPGCGDSGGPLLTYNATGGYTQVGFVSWSYGVPWPDVFTRVSAFRDWIDVTTDKLLARGRHPVLGKSRPRGPADAREGSPFERDEQRAGPAGGAGAGPLEAAP